MDIKKIKVTTAFIINELIKIHFLHRVNFGLLFVEINDESLGSVLINYFLYTYLSNMERNSEFTRKESSNFYNI